MKPRNEQLNNELLERQKKSGGRHEDKGGEHAKRSRQKEHTRKEIREALE